jgi:hypothetical protein
MNAHIKVQLSEGCRVCPFEWRGWCQALVRLRDGKPECPPQGVREDCPLKHGQVLEVVGFEE